MRTKYLVAAAFAALLAAPASGQSVKAGIEAWQRADYSGAVAVWRPLALHGDADAQFNLGQAYRLGRGVPLDLSLAKVWFQRAANSGHLDAQATLGLLLFQNGEKVEGVKWLRRAADQNEPRAQLVYGTALYNGDGVTQDRLLGYAYVSRAAAQGLAPAQDTLSQLDSMLPPADRRLALSMAANAQRAPQPAARPKSETLKAPQTPPAKLVHASPSTPKPAAAKPPAAKAAKPPVTKPAPVAAVSGHWRIQLGAFSQRGAAEALYRRVSGKAILAGRTPYYVAAGPVTRLQVGPFPSKAAAASACSSLGISCFAVPAG
jgi:uncharacterized protein